MGSVHFQAGYVWLEAAGGHDDLDIATALAVLAADLAPPKKVEMGQSERTVARHRKFSAPKPVRRRSRFPVRCPLRAERTMRAARRAMAEPGTAASNENRSVCSARSRPDPSPLPGASGDVCFACGTGRTEERHLPPQIGLTCQGASSESQTGP